MNGGHQLTARDQHALEPRRRGVELVVYSETVFRSVFVVGLVVVVISVIGTLLFLPLRESAEPVATAVTAMLLLVIALCALLRATELYAALRRRPRLEFVPVLLAAMLLAALPMLESSLWWTVCAVLMTLATVVPLRRALFYSLVALLANLIVHLAAGDLGDTEPVAIIGLWVGLPFWTFVFGFMPDVIARHVLWLRGVVGASASTTPIRVVAWGEEQFSTLDDDLPVVAKAPGDGDTRAPVSAARLDRLTVRQLQVVGLLVEGLRYREVARLLSISERQVQRHVAEAVRRAGARTASELVALAAAGATV